MKKQKKTKKQKRRSQQTAPKKQNIQPTQAQSIKIKAGNIVTLHYRKKLAINGAVIEESRLQEPLRFQVGAKQIIPSFENAILGMTRGEKKELLIPAAEAHGELSTENIFIVKRHQIKANFDYKVGQVLIFEQSNGQKVATEVLKITPSSVILNSNNPLAGEDLYFDVEILDIQ